jgi:AcrR family transcriptional regulator
MEAEPMSVVEESEAQPSAMAEEAVAVTVAAAAEIDAAELRDLDEAMAEVEPATARRILGAAVVAFAARGYHATSTRDIAAQAGLSPAGVYVHFRSKEDLLHRISLIGTRQSHEAVHIADEAGSDPMDRLREVIRVLATGRVIEYELGSLSVDHYAEIAALRRDIDLCVRRILDDGVREGVFDVPDVPATVLALLSLTVDIARWYRTAGRRSPEDVGDLYADLAVRMVRAVAA